LNAVSAAPCASSAPTPPRQLARAMQGTWPTYPVAAATFSSCIEPHPLGPCRDLSSLRHAFLIPRRCTLWTCDGAGVDVKASGGATEESFAGLTLARSPMLLFSGIPARLTKSSAPSATISLRQLCLSVRPNATALACNRIEGMFRVNRWRGGCRCEPQPDCDPEPRQRRVRRIRRWLCPGFARGAHGTGDDKRWPQ
jgi:hypothetical protein